MFQSRRDCSDVCRGFECVINLEKVKCIVGAADKRCFTCWSPPAGVLYPLQEVHWRGFDSLSVLLRGGRLHPSRYPKQTLRLPVPAAAPAPAGLMPCVCPGVRNRKYRQLATLQLRHHRRREECLWAEPAWRRGVGGRIRRIGLKASEVGRSSARNKRRHCLTSEELD